MGDRKPPCRSSPSPSSSSFSEQALRFNHTMDLDFMHNPRDFYTIQRQIEKDRIRHEIITAENVHRRLLEEEVRRELRMEREMVRASKMSLSIDERLSMQVPASFRLMHPLNNRWLEDRFAFPGNRGMGFGHDAPTPTLLQFSDTAKEEITSTLGVNKKDKLIMLSKPNPNLCGSNTKAATPPAGSGELPLTRSKKPTEWSCALCQVSATCERGLNEHLHGKKHKAKEARLPNHSTSSMSNKSGKKIKLSESREVEEESVEAMVGLDLKMKGVEDSENKNEESPKEDLDEKTWMKKCILTAEKTKIKVPNRKNFKFWCEDCQVGTHSAVVMEGHKRGKKHTSRCIESNPNSAAVLGNTSVRIMAPSEPTEKAEKGNEETTVIVTGKPEDEEVMAEEASEETMENITEKVEDEDVVAKEVIEETAENVTGESDCSGSYIVGEVADLTKQTP